MRILASVVSFVLFFGSSLGATPQERGSEYLPSRVCGDPDLPWQLVLSVVDVTGAYIPGVSVTLAVDEIERTEATDDRGWISISGVIEAEWTISFELPGFQRVVSRVSVEPGCVTAMVVPLQVIPSGGIPAKQVKVAERVAGNLDFQCVLEAVGSAERVESVAPLRAYRSGEVMTAEAILRPPEDVDGPTEAQLYVIRWWADIEFRASWTSVDESPEYEAYLRSLLEALLADSVADCSDL